MAVAYATEDREALAREKRRRVVMTEHLMAIADELTEALAMEKPSKPLSCPRHTTVDSKRPTLCPMCALIVCRERMQPARGRE